VPEDPLHRSEIRDLGLDIIQVRAGHDPNLGTRSLALIGELEELPDLVNGEPERAGAADKCQPLPAPYSRVIEVDPHTRGIVWEYRDQSLFDFFSPYIGGAQRLPNGNTLICEGCRGRIFEVTRDGQVVWEYVNPHFYFESSRAGLNNWVFRAFRYSSAEIERARHP